MRHAGETLRRLAAARNAKIALQIFIANFTGQVTVKILSKKRAEGRAGREARGGFARRPADRNIAQKAAAALGAELPLLGESGARRG